MATYKIPGTSLTININDDNGGNTNAASVAEDFALAAKNSPTFSAALNTISQQYQNVNINFVDSKSSLEHEFTSGKSDDGKSYNVDVSTNSSVSVSEGSSIRMVTFIDGVTHELFHSIASGEKANDLSKAAQDADEAFVRGQTTIVQHELEEAGVASYNNVYDNTRTHDIDSTEEGIPFLSGGGLSLSEVVFLVGEQDPDTGLTTALMIRRLKPLIKAATWLTIISSIMTIMAICI